MSHSIADAIAQAIHDRRLPPGTKLGEREASEVFGVSRTVVRQGFIRLADAGIVVIRSHRGASVAKPSPRETMDIYQTMGFLQQGVAGFLAESLPPDFLRELDQHVSSQERAFLERNDELFNSLGEEFHLKLIATCENQIVRDLYFQLCSRARLLRSLYRSNFNYRLLIGQHREYVACIRRGQVAKLQKLMGEHHHAVARSYSFIEEVGRPVTFATAMEPYLAGSAILSKSLDR